MPLRLSARFPYLPQALTDMCWALASFGFTPPDTWLLKLEQELIGRRQQGDGGMQQLSPNQAAVILWALQCFAWVPRRTLQL